MPTTWCPRPCCRATETSPYACTRGCSSAIWPHRRWWWPTPSPAACCKISTPSRWAPPPTVHRSTCAISDAAMTMTMSAIAADVLRPEMFERNSAAILTGTEAWQHLAGHEEIRFDNGPDSTYIPTIDEFGHRFIADELPAHGIVSGEIRGHRPCPQQRIFSVFAIKRGSHRQSGRWSATTSSGDSSRPETRPVVVDRHSPKLSVAGRSPHRALDE